VTDRDRDPDRKADLLSRGFDAGNYANAYVSEDYSTAFETTLGTCAEQAFDAYCVGFVLGFFATYELHEIPSDCRDMFDSAYHSDNGQAVVAAGYTESRADCYDGEVVVAS